MKKGHDWLNPICVGVAVGVVMMTLFVARLQGG